MTEPAEDPRRVVGWRERVDLVDWGLRRVRAKIDTGARTSAIDVAEIQELPDGRLRFEVVSRLRPVRRTRWVEATPVRTSSVKPSDGQLQQRHVCRTRIRLDDIEREIEIGLVRRTGMLCRMLLGRTALAGVAIVDPGAKYLVTRRRTDAKKRR